MDYLNAGHAAWCHPCDSKDTSTESFMELYARALDDAADGITRVYDAITRAAPLDGLGQEVGNQSLDTGREQCVPVHSKPLPLWEIIDDMYAKIDAVMEAKAEAERAPSQPPSGAHTEQP